MRKIEMRMIEAIQSGNDWKSGNTEVWHNENGAATVFLHGYLIAIVRDDVIKFCDHGWQTATTKSRMNAILRGLNVPAMLFQDNWTWHFRSTKPYGSDGWFGTVVDPGVPFWVRLP